MHVAGTQNTAADFLSRIDLNPKERVELKIRNDITIQPIQVNLQSTDVADEEQPLQDTTFTSLKSLLNILKCSTREFSLAPNVLFFVLILPICMF